MERAERGKKRPMPQHTPLCDGWKSWILCNRTGTRELDPE
jgi:hypothetical protein